MKYILVFHSISRRAGSLKKISIDSFILPTNEDNQLVAFNDWPSMKRSQNPR